MADMPRSETASIFRVVFIIYVHLLELSFRIWKLPGG
jgi:hypothetical protein